MSGLTDSGDVLLRVENLVKYFPVKSSQLFGVNAISCTRSTM